MRAWLPSGRHARMHPKPGNTQSGAGRSPGRGQGRARDATAHRLTLISLAVRHVIPSFLSSPFDRHHFPRAAPAALGVAGRARSACATGRTGAQSPLWAAIGREP